MRPEDVVVQGVVDYFSSSKYDQFSIKEKCSIQMGSESREADIVLIDRNEKFAAIIECKRSGYEGKGIPQLKSYLSATNTPLGVFANETTPTDWKFYKNRGQNQFKQIDHSQFERKLLKTNIIGTLRKWWERLFPPQRIINSSGSSANLLVDQNAHKELTLTRQLYLEYWTALQDLLNERNSVITPGKPSTDNWLYCKFDYPNFSLSASAHVADKWICVSLTMKGKDGKRYFYLLAKDKVDIQKEIGAELEWDEKSERGEDHVSLCLYETDPGDRQDWDRQHQWFCQQLGTFYHVFLPRIQALDARNYQPEMEEIS